MLNNLLERKSVGYLYHFIDWRKLQFLIDKQFVFEFKKDNLYMTDYFYLSTTRKYDFDWGSIRIVFNGTEISDNYKIKPVHFNNKMAMKNHKRFDSNYPLDSRNMKQNNYNNQYEERIMSKNISNDLSRYIHQIDILSLMGKDLYNYVKDNINIDIPINLVDTFNIAKGNTELNNIVSFNNFK